MTAIDTVFERHRNPSMFYYDKEVCMRLPGRSAKEPRISP